MPYIYPNRVLAYPENLMVYICPIFIANMGKRGNVNGFYAT